MNVNESLTERALPAGESARGFAFSKRERLSYSSLVDRLYTLGKKEYAYPLRLTYRLVERASLPEPLRGASLRMMVTVPKKKLHHAVDRVRMRRLIKEAWRLNRIALRDAVAANKPGYELHVSVIYLDDKLASFHTISAKVCKAIEMLRKCALPGELKTSEIAATADESVK